MLPSNKLTLTAMEASISENSATSSVSREMYSSSCVYLAHLQDKTSAVVQLAATADRHRSNRPRMVPEPALAQAATKPHHSNHQPVAMAVVRPVVTTHHSLQALVLVAVQAATNQPRTRATQAMVLTLASPLVELPASVAQTSNRPHRALKFSNTQRMLKVSSKTPTHKSSVEQLPAVCKPTHRTFAFASCNHPRFHPRA